MISISEHANRWLQDNPVHLSMLSNGLMNASALARHIKPSLDAAAGGHLSVQAITLALTRLAKNNTALAVSDFRQYIGEVSVQSGLSVLTVPQAKINIDAFYDALKQLHRDQEYALYTSGVWHTALIGGQETITRLQQKFTHTIVRHGLTGVTVKLRPGHLEVPGVCGYILELLAQRGVNLTEVASSHDEMTVIIDAGFTKIALDALMRY